MLYHLAFRVEYSADQSQNDLFSIWAEEAEAALGAKKAGVVVDLWKVVGERRVFAVVDVDELGDRDHQPEFVLSKLNLQFLEQSHLFEFLPLHDPQQCNVLSQLLLL